MRKSFVLLCSEPPLSRELGSLGGSSGTERVKVWYLKDTGGHAGILCYMDFKEVLRSFLAPSSKFTVCLTSVVLVFQEGLWHLCIFHAYSSSGLAGRGSHSWENVMDSLEESCCQKLRIAELSRWRILA